MKMHLIMKLERKDKTLVRWALCKISSQTYYLKGAKEELTTFCFNGSLSVTLIYNQGHWKTYDWFSKYYHCDICDTNKYYYCDTSVTQLDFFV